MCAYNVNFVRSQGTDREELLESLAALKRENERLTAEMEKMRVNAEHALLMEKYKVWHSVSQR